MKKRRKDFYSQYWNGHKWILSNFANHHLRNVHPIANNANQAPEESDTDEQNPRTKSSHSILQVDDLIKSVENSVDICTQRFKKFQNEKTICSFFSV